MVSPTIWNELAVSDWRVGWKLGAGMANVGKIQRGTRSHECKKQMHQLHVCLPAGARKTRLLYRMSMNYLQWAKGFSLMKLLWKAVAEQVARITVFAMCSLCLHSCLRAPVV